MGSTRFERTEKHIAKLTKELEKNHCGPLNAETQGRQKEVQILIENLLDQKEIYWLQHIRAN